MDKTLFEACEKCLMDEPSATTARCPIHLDVPSLAGEVEKGDFKKAYKVLEKRLPFAGIIGMICDHPCEQACVRAGLDAPVAVHELERAAVRHGYAPFKKGFSSPKSGGKAAVVGGGLSGLAAAFELDKRGVSVTLFEKSDRLGGQVWNYEGTLIDRSRIEEELSIVGRLGIPVHYNHPVGEDELRRLGSEYDAVYLGTGVWDGALPVSPDTFQVSGGPVFAGGRLVTRNDSVIEAVSSGKRAAVSIERYIKKISLTAARDREGAFVTPLNYNMEDAVPAPRVEKTQDVYTREEAASEAKRCLKCRCRECVNACPHLRRFGVTPKTYARQILINEDVIMGTRYANKMINSCAQCGLCTEECPIGLGMPEIIRETRESMVEKGKMPPSAHDFALRDMAFSNSSRFFMVKSPPPIPEDKRAERERELFTYPRITYSKYAQSLYNGDAPGTEKVDYLFYPGCQLSASSPEYVEKAYDYLLSHIKEGVGLMLGCCGAPADWAGRQDLMKESTARLRSAWESLGKPTFVLACSSCYQIFTKYLPDVPIVSLWEIFARCGLPEGAAKGGGRELNIHDACSTRHNAALQDSVRQVVTALGYTVRELKYTKSRTKCCGYGGLVYYANRDQAKAFVSDRAGESPDDLLVYCAMCKDLFVDGGKRTYHLLDLVFGDGSEELALKKMPNLSQRHENRAALKARLLKNFWKEEPETQQKEKSALIIPPDVWAVMEERYILLEDIEKVVASSQSSGARFFNPEGGSYLADLRLENVTYWVVYTEKEDGVHIVSVYSHRMEIVEE